MKNGVDLHIHTTASDGTLTPLEVVRAAKRIGLKTIAITDHDTLAGNKEALREGKILGLEVIPGVEISAHSRYGEMHILGYYIDFEDKILEENLTLLVKNRNKRNSQIIEKLSDLGLEITLEEVRQLASNGIVGRSHFARVMVKKKYVSSIAEAFKKYLGDDGQAFVPKINLEVAKAIGLIKKAGGLPVLAHPSNLEVNIEDLEALIKELIDFGLKGIEAYSSTHRPQETANYKKLAQKYKLIITGGSDFHGDVKDGLEIGRGYGNLRVPYSVAENLKTSWKERSKILENS